MSMFDPKSPPKFPGKPGSGMRHVLNGAGDAVITTRQTTLD